MSRHWLAVFFSSCSANHVHIRKGRHIRKRTILMGTTLKKGCVGGAHPVVPFLLWNLIVNQKRPLEKEKNLAADWSFFLGCGGSFPYAVKEKWHWWRYLFPQPPINISLINLYGKNAGGEYYVCSHRRLHLSQDLTTAIFTFPFMGRWLIKSWCRDR